MRKMLLFHFFLLSACSYCSAQNLVPNPSFDTIVGPGCPAGIGGCGPSNLVQYAKGWSAYGGTPDYFNSCGSIYVGLPRNDFGYQNAVIGNAYCGLVAAPYDREWIGAQLITPLVVGNKYTGTLIVSRADSCSDACNNLGISFSMNPYTDVCINRGNETNHAMVYDTSVINDTSVWTTILGSFIADSEYNYVIIGNFFSDSLSNIVFEGNAKFNEIAYYYIGYVSVTRDTTTGTAIIDTITQAICQNQSYGGHDTTGTFTDTFTTTGGYDSVRVLNLTVITPVVNVTKQTICPGDSFAGHSIGGYYYDTIFSTGGCDSIITKLELDISPLLADTVFDTILKGQTYSGYDSAGIYVDTFTATNDCDSIRTLLLTVKDTTTGITQPLSPITPHLIIYPNPASTSINVSATVPMDGFVVYNPEGQEIMRRVGIKTKQATIDLQSWAKGVYILQATIGQQKLVRRFTVLE